MTTTNNCQEEVRLRQAMKPATPMLRLLLIVTNARPCNQNCRLDPRVTPPCLAEFHSGLLLLTLSLNVAWLGQARLLYQFHQLALILRRMKAAIERRTSDSTVQSLLRCFISSTRTSLSSAPRGKIA